MQVDPRTVATGGFMRNVCAVLLNFCEPFLDIRASKVSLIHEEGGNLDCRKLDTLFTC